MNIPNWRDRALRLLNSLFAKSAPAHGLQHALATEHLVIEIANKSGFDGNEADFVALQAAALLHDIGYVREKASWSRGKVEHVRESVRLAQRFLAGVPPFSEDLTLQQTVYYLILHHDDTNYSFPICQGSNAVVSDPHKYESLFDWSRLKEEATSTRETMLEILKEADALLGTGADGARRTWDYSLTRALPPVSLGNPLAAWAWEESIVGNVRLAAKRALLDARSLDGKHIATRKHWEVESSVRRFCERNGLIYESEPSLQRFYGKRAVYGPQVCRVKSYQDWAKLVEILRRTPLRGDPSLYPCAAMRIQSLLVPLDALAPLSLYALRSQVELHKFIQPALLRSHALDIFDLSGIVEFDLGDRFIRMAPPIVARYLETKGDVKGEVWGLVDGLHRCTAAREMGVSHIRAVVLSEIPPQFPLVPLPLEWRDVRVVTDVPKLYEKRKFRFEDTGSLEAFLSDFPATYADSPRPVDDRTAKYYHFWEFSALGSSGIRMSPPDVDLTHTLGAR